MSGTVIDEPMTEAASEETEFVGPDISKLQDHTPAALRSPRVLAGLTFAVGLIYFVLCIRPLWYSDVWGHLAYGRLIWEEKSLPATEPLMPLATGMAFVDTAWLCQVIGYLTVSHLGHAGLQGLYALSIAICVALLAARTYQKTRSGWFSLLTMGGFLMSAGMSLSIIRPQIGGMVCFLMLLFRLTGRRLHRSDWILIPALFAVWANIHGSFLTGLFLMSSFVLGRAIDVGIRTGSWRAIIRDHRVRRNFLLLELAAAAVVLNPYGIGVYSAVLQVAANPNLNDLVEWHPQVLQETTGVLFGATIVALAILYRCSPRRVRSWEVISLVVLGWATFNTSRMIVWWAPVAMLLLAVHGQAVWRRWRRLPRIPEAPARAGKWSVVTVGLIWIFFAYSPLGIRLIHGKSPTLERSVSSETPLAVARYLREKPPAGQIFNTFEWGDYLQWAGPEGLKIFVNSHAHLVPREVWLAYMQISDVQSGWEDALDRYGINTIVAGRWRRKACPLTRPAGPRRGRCR